MVKVELTTDPNASDITEFIDRIQPGGAMERGFTASKVLSFDSEPETLQIDFQQFKRVLLEHQQFERAKGFSDTAMDILRVVENGPDRMRFDEIRSTLNDDYVQKNRDPLADQTFQHHLRELREKGLIAHAHNSYTYVGP